MSGLGCGPKKQRSAIIFVCKQHNKQIAKMRFDKDGGPSFALRILKVPDGRLSAAAKDSMKDGSLTREG